MDDLLALHQTVRDRHPRSVSKGRINRNRVASISEKPFTVLYGQAMYDTIFRKAACLMEGIIRLHPFPDGNKRTALLATHYFLYINKYYMVTPLDAVRFMVGVAQNKSRTDGEIDTLINDIAAWLQSRTATSKKGYDLIEQRYVSRPARNMLLLLFTGVGIIYARRKIRYWLAADTHPEYAKNAQETISFLLGMTRRTSKLVKE